MEDTKILRSLYVFRGLNQIELAQFNKVLEARSVTAGERIIEEGAEPHELYLIKKGRFRVLKRDVEGERELAELAAGEHFGEIGLIDKRPRSASVEAITDGELLVLGYADVERILEQYPEVRLRIYENFLESLCDRLRAANENLLIAAQLTEA